MLVHSFENGGEESEEANVLVRSLTWLEEVQAIEIRRVGDHGHRPVTMFTRAVDSREGLLMQKRLKPMSQCDTPECCHHEHVVIDGEIGLFEIRRHLELAGRDFVVTSSDRHAELVQLELRFSNASLDALRDSAEVVVLELLPAWRRSADKGTPAHHQIGAHGVVRAIDEEVFLLGSEGGEDALDTLVAQELEELDGFLERTSELRSSGVISSSASPL